MKDSNSAPNRSNNGSNNVFSRIQKTFPIFFLTVIVSLIPVISCQQGKATEGDALIRASLNSSIEKTSELLLYTTFDLLNENHYLKRPLNEAHFKEIFDAYLFNVDRERLFFTAREVDDLFKQHLPQSDLKPLLKLPQESFSLLKTRSQQYFKYAKKMLANPIDFTVEENYETDPLKQQFVDKQSQLEQRWRRNLKNRVLRLILQDLTPDSSIKQVEKAGEDLKTVENDKDLSFPDAEKKARETTMKNLQRLFAGYYDTITLSDLENDYLNAIALSYDKHSAYLPPLDKENFDIGMGGELEGIGAEISKSEDGLIEIRGIIPGGPTYRQKEIDVGDKIVSVGQSIDKLIDVESISLNEALSMIRGKKGTTVYLKILKKDGKIKMVTTVRDRVVLESTYAKSAVLKDREAKIGYLYLPKFYRDFSGKIKRNATSDVQAELEKLNEAGVEGLVFDLRNNGGGALEDAVLISGLFINRGPILSIRSKNNNKNAVYDRNPGVAFDKPIVILLNYVSASASEILAAALQDYGRAIIVGTDKSHGKGTVQSVTSISDYYRVTTSDGDQFGYIKYTFQKFYRITGFSTQVQGVLSDITLPFLMQRIGEDDKRSFYANVLPGDTISPVKHQLWSKFQYPIAELKRKSKDRIRKSKVFSNIVKRHELVREYDEKTLLPLNFDQALAQRVSYLEKLETYPVDLNKTLDFDVEGRSYSQTEKEKSGFKEKAEEFNQWLAEVNKDIYIGEALKIVKDINASIKTTKAKVGMQNKEDDNQLKQQPLTQK